MAELKKISYGQLFEELKERSSTLIPDGRKEINSIVVSVELLKKMYIIVVKNIG